MNKLMQAGAQRASGLWAWLKTHRLSVEILAVLLFGILLVDILTFVAGFGGNDDPGTYTSQAYAVLAYHKLAHYTYWYDHPPFGWIQIALYMLVTDGFHRPGPATIKAGELMVIAQLVSCVLIYLLMRRLQFKRFFAALAVVLFALSPLAVQYQKMAFLDNLSVTWMLAALVLAASPRKSLGAAIGSGLCMVATTLTKETSAIWLLVVVYLLWQHSGEGRRLWAILLNLATFVITTLLLYGGYAAIKNELFPGAGHVSLLGSLFWQLGRPGGYNTLWMWLGIDHWLLYLALAALLPAFLVKRLRPIALGLVVMVIMVVRGGYLPSPFIIGVLPFAAMVLAGVLGALWPQKITWDKSARWFKRVVPAARVTAVVAVIGVLGVFAGPKWTQFVHDQIPRGEETYYTMTIQGVEQTIPKDAVIAVDDNMWVDLTQAGYKNVVWFYKLDLDPAVADRYVSPKRGGYQGIDYIVLKSFYFDIASRDGPNSVVMAAYRHSTLVAQYGNTQRELGQYVEPYYVYKVNK